MNARPALSPHRLVRLHVRLAVRVLTALTVRDASFAQKGRPLLPAAPWRSVPSVRLGKGQIAAIASAQTVPREDLVTKAGRSVKSAARVLTAPPRPKSVLTASLERDPPREHRFVKTVSLQNSATVAVRIAWIAVAESLPYRAAVAVQPAWPERSRVTALRAVPALLGNFRPLQLETVKTVRRGRPSLSPGPPTVTTARSGDSPIPMVSWIVPFALLEGYPYPPARRTAHRVEREKSPTVPARAA